MSKIEGYCFKCKKKMPFMSAALTGTSTGRPVIKGVDTHGHHISRLVSQADINRLQQRGMIGKGLLGSITGMDFGPLKSIPLIGPLLF